MKNPPQPAKSNIGQPPSKPKKVMSSMWDVYPEAVACYVGGLCPDFHLGERILL